MTDFIFIIFIFIFISYRARGLRRFPTRPLRTCCVVPRRRVSRRSQTILIDGVDSPGIRFPTDNCLSRLCHHLDRLHLDDWLHPHLLFFLNLAAHELRFYVSSAEVPATAFWWGSFASFVPKLDTPTTKFTSCQNTFYSSADPRVLFPTKGFK